MTFLITPARGKKQEYRDLITKRKQIVRPLQPITIKDQSTFYVYRNILASVSVYFKSQFRAQVEIVEQRTFTSTIHLHQNAIDAFPVFLDYLYSPEQGKMHFSRDNAVALRHLAMNFGVDMLLEEITHIILDDIKNKDSRENYHNSACIFLDDVLLEALKMMNTRQEALIAVSAVIHATLIEKPESFLSNESAFMTAWKKIVSNLDMGYDAFFAHKNTERFPDLYATAVRVSDQVSDPYADYFASMSSAGPKHVLGTYKLVGVADGVGLYTNGVCFLERIGKFWYISFGCNKEWSKKKYHCTSNSDSPPFDGWTSLSSTNHGHLISFQLDKKK